MESERLGFPSIGEDPGTQCHPGPTHTTPWGLRLSDSTGIIYQNLLLNL